MCLQKEGTMLKLKYLFENFEQAKECLKLYDVEEESINEMFTYFRISSNAIYPFREKSKGKVCFLRVSPVEEKSYADVQSEIHLIEWLIEQNFPAMKPYPMKEGSLSKQIKTQWGTVNVSCFEAVFGETLEDINGTPELAYGYGKTLGLLHRKLMDYPFTSERKNHNELLEEIYNRLVLYHAPDYVISELFKVKEELSTLPLDNENYGMIHYDFEPDNVLFDKETGAFGVIDFDDAIRCFYALDIVRAIDAMDDVVGESSVNIAIEKFLEGYQSEKTLLEAQIHSFPLMRRLVQLQSYATILHVLSDVIVDAPDWMVQIKQKLDNKRRLIEENIKFCVLL